MEWNFNMDNNKDKKKFLVKVKLVLPELSTQKLRKDLNILKFNCGDKFNIKTCSIMPTIETKKNTINEVLSKYFIKFSKNLFM